MNQKIQRFILLAIGVLAMSLAIGYLVFAWVEPTAPPPGGNVPAPINVGDVAQGKLGGLVIGSQDTTLLGGHIGIAISGNTNDKIRIYGTQADPHTIWLGNDRGLRLWDGSGASQGEILRITSLEAGGRVGIGTTTPAYKLDVNGDARIATSLGVGTTPSAGYGIRAAGSTMGGYFWDTDNTGVAYLAYGNSGVRGGGSEYGGYFWDTDGTSGVHLAYGSWGIYTANDAYFGGNVGIGTTAPAYKLDVNGDIRISGVYRRGNDIGQNLTCGAAQVIKGATVSGGIITAGSCADDLTGGGGEIYWVLSGSNLYTSSTAWNVGIGTTSPVEKLQVVGNVNIDNRLFVRSGSGWGGSPTISLAIGDNDTGFNWISDGNLAIYTNSAERMRIDSSGNVGIGTTGPSYKLHVQGGDIYSSGYVRGGTGLCIGSDCRTSWPSGGGGIGGSGTANYVAKFTDATTIGNSQIYDNGTNVGIGTTSPVEKLQVAGNVNIDNRLFVRSGSGWSGSPTISLAIGDNDTGLHWISDGNLAIYTNNAERVRIKSDGHVQFSGKIGTDGYSPNSGLPAGWGGGVHTWDLVSEASIAARQICIDTTGSGDGWTGLDCRTSWPSGIGGSGTANYVAKFTAATTIGNSQIYDNGTNVGIGTANPGVKLDIVGDRARLQTTSGTGGPYFVLKHGGEASGREFAIGSSGSANAPGVGKFEIYDSTAGASRLVIDANGNVGIGTPNPQRKLHIHSGFPQIRTTDPSGGETWEFGSGTGGWAIYNATDGAYRLWIGNDGNVGIGTTSPTQKLEVEGGNISIDAWDSQYRGGYSAGGYSDRRMIGGAHGWDPNKLYINGWNDWTSGVSIGGPGGTSNLFVTGNTEITGNLNVGGRISSNNWPKVEYATRGSGSCVGGAEEILSRTITVNTASKIIIMAYLPFNVSATVRPFVMIRRDSTDLWSTGSILNNGYQTVTISAVDEVGAGTYTYKVVIWCEASGNVTWGYEVWSGNRNRLHLILTAISP